MSDKERVVKEKCKSRFFKGIAGWFVRHGAVCAAILLIAVSAVLATFETDLIYAGKSNADYGIRGTTGSTSYTAGSGNDPSVYEPGVIGVSVVTYDLKNVGSSGLKYGYKADDTAAAVASTGSEEAIKAATKQYGRDGLGKKEQKLQNDLDFYPFWIYTGNLDKGDKIYKYSNNLQHTITKNILSMQTAKSYDSSTLVFVPRVTARSWTSKLKQKVIGKQESKNHAVFYNPTTWYKETDAGNSQKVSQNVIDGVNGKDKSGKTVKGTGIYYAKLKAYIKNKQKKDTKKNYISIEKKVDGKTKTYEVCNYTQFSKMTTKDMDEIIGYTGKGSLGFSADGEKKLAKAKKLYSSMANINEVKSKTYTTAPQSALFFLLYTTSAGLGEKEYGTAMFSKYGKAEGIYGNNKKTNGVKTNNKMVSEDVMRALFSSDRYFNAQLAKNRTKDMTDVHKLVLNNEYNTHYLDMLFCGYALARASGESQAITAWRKAIDTYVKSSADNSDSMKNVVIRMDTGMLYSTKDTSTFASTGSIINKHYGLGNVSSFAKANNATSFSKGFIGFATNSSYDTSNQNYQSPNAEIAKNGVVTKTAYNKIYGNYYKRLENAIKATGKAISTDNYTWYGTMMAARATKYEYFRATKNSEVEGKVKNKLSVVALLKMGASPSGSNPWKGDTSSVAWNYGTYAIDGFAWKSPTTVDDDSTDNPDLKFNLAIYSTKANAKAPSANGKEIKNTFQSYTTQVAGDSTTVTDDLYVKLSPTTDKKSQAAFNKIISSNDYYVKVVFVDASGNTVTSLDGKTTKTVKTPKGGSVSQQKGYDVALNAYDSTNKENEKGDEQNYNKLVSAKQIGGKDLQNNKCLIWRISNSKVRTAGLKVSGTSAKYVNWKAQIYIYKKSGSGSDTQWKNYFSGKKINAKTVKKTDMGKGDYTETNNVIAQYIGKESDPDEDDVNLSGTYESTPEAYAELKEGSVYNETFEAMAGTPSTRSLYFATGGSEFIVNMQAVYDDYNLEEVGGNKNSYRSTRTYKSIFKKVDCEYKKGDQLKNLAAGGSTTETFVSDNQDKKSEKTITVEKNNAVNPSGASSYNTTVKGHGETTKFEATWTGTISNSTPEPKDNGKFNPGKPGSPCAGNGFNPGTQRTKATADTNWNVDAYNNALSQAFSWAKQMEQIGGSADGTAWRIADSDGYKRIYDVGDAVITVTMSGGSKSNAIECGSSASFSKNGTYTSSQQSAATVKSNDSGVLGSGYSYTKGQYGKGSGYHAGAHGHRSFALIPSVLQTLRYGSCIPATCRV